MTSHLERVQAVVIGGGVIGCAVLRELAQRGVDVLLVEAEPALCEGTSKANSAIVHTGFDARPGSVEAGMLRRASSLWQAMIEELRVPFLAVGALMLARSSDELPGLTSERENAAELGVATELLDRSALRDLAPFVTDAALAALSIPGEGVIDPFWLTRRYAEAGIAAGGRLRLGAGVTELSVTPDAVELRLEDGTRVRAEQAVNCAGLRADELARRAGDGAFSLRPRRGQFLVSEETFGVDRIVLPLPGPMGKGMLVTPIVFGGLLLGPTAEDRDDKGDRSVDTDGRTRILAACHDLVPAVRQMTPIRQFAGLRAVSSTGDYILRPSAVGDRLYHAAGIRSTGISSSPAVAEFVAEDVTRLRGWGRVAAARAIAEPAMAEEPGPVVCPCRWVSRGEVEVACRPPVGASTLDAAKRSSGAAFGDCQGNLCAVDVAAVVAAAQDWPIERVMKHRLGSWLFEAGSAADRPAERAGWTEPRAGSAFEIVVIGGGLSGIGAALAVAELGARVLLVERRARLGGALRSSPDHLTAEERDALESLDKFAEPSLSVWPSATAIGLVEDDDGWLVQVQRGTATVDIHASRVVLASGGYVEPREHLLIAGERPSGVMTADLAHAALDAGLLPGLRLVVVGGGRYAAATRARLEAVGLAVEQQDVDVATISELRGDRRLEAVCIEGRWREADALVLAHRLVPAPLLLRQLGLLDGRISIPAPADETGATPLAGMWAAGACRLPDIDHSASLRDGMEVGRRIAATLAVRAAR